MVGSGQGKFITLRPEANDSADCDIRKIRVLAKRLARVHIADMYFDERQIHGEQGIAQCNARMRECAGIQDDEITGAGSLLDPVYELSLRIALKRGKAVTEIGGLAGEALLDLGQRRIAVDTRFARAEQVQICAIDEQEVRHGL